MCLLQKRLDSFLTENGTPLPGKTASLQNTLQDFCAEQNAFFSANAAGQLSGSLEGALFYTASQNKLWQAEQEKRKKAFLRFSQNLPGAPKNEKGQKLAAAFCQADYLTLSGNGSLLYCTEEPSDCFEFALQLVGTAFPPSFNAKLLLFFPEISKTPQGWRLDFAQHSNQEDDTATLWAEANPPPCQKAYIDFLHAVWQPQMYNFTHSPFRYGYLPSDVENGLEELQLKQEVFGLAALPQKEQILASLADIFPIGAKTPQALRNTPALLPLIAALAEEAGLPKVAALAQACILKRGLAGETLALRRLTAALKYARCKPLYRLLWQQMRTAANHYPVRARQYLSPVEWETLSSAVEKAMKENGYEGQYPYFKKLTQVTQPRWREIESRFSFIGRNQYAAGYIECAKDADSTELFALKIFLETCFLKQEERDVFDQPLGKESPAYYRKPRTVQTLFFSCEAGPESANALSRCAAVAAKAAACYRLTRKEKKEFAFRRTVRITPSFWAVLCLLGSAAISFAVALAITASAIFTAVSAYAGQPDLLWPAVLAAAIDFPGAFLVIGLAMWPTSFFSGLFKVKDWHLF